MKVVTATNQTHHKNQKTYILNYGNVCLTSDTLAVLVFVVCHGPWHTIVYLNSRKHFKYSIIKRKKSPPLLTATHKSFTINYLAIVEVVIL